jgi:type IV pilus assembly protein PilB
MGVEPYLVSSALDCVIAQRLARRLCSRCRRPVEATPEMVRQMGGGAGGPVTVYEAVGCKVCSDTGYRGRLAISEIMLVSEEIQRMAVDRRPSDEIRKIAVEQGMATLRMDGMEKVRIGMTTLEEVLRVVV